MYACGYYMPGKIEYYRVKKRRNIWVLPVFFCTFLVLGAVFVLLGYYAGKGQMQMVMAEEVSGNSLMQEDGEWSQGSPESPQQETPVQPLPTETPQPTEPPGEEVGPLSTEQPEAEIGPEITENSQIDTVPEKTKTMYLTFDDGPSAEYTDTILDVLAKYDIKATFFLVGENVEKRPEVAKRIAEEGHAIGIHCYSHAYDDIYDSVESYVEDFEKAYQVIYETTGVEVKIFRFPGGSVNGYNKHVCKDIITEMTERGYVYFDWNASLEDAVKKTTPEELVKNAKDTAMDRERVILLAHDTIYNTSLCIEDIILQFPEYKMEPLDEEVVPIRFRLN